MSSNPRIIKSGGAKDTCPFPRRETDFSSLEGMTLDAGTDLEKALKRFAKKFSALNFSSPELLSDIDTIHKEIDFYGHLEYQRNAGRIFPSPDKTPNICVAHPHRLKDGEVFDLSYSSTYTPLYRGFDDQYFKHPENHEVHARVWRHDEGQSRGTLFALHGWQMGDQRVNALALFPGYFYSLGFNVIIYELPYHGRRAPSSNAIALFPSLNIARTNEAMIQAIFELRALHRWVRDSEAHPIGVYGVSMGGYLAALWSALDAIDFSIVAVPAVSVADIAWQIIELMMDSHAEMLSPIVSRLSLDQLKQGFEIHSPLTYRSKVPRERSVIVASENDPLIPAWQSNALWNHWGQTEIMWLKAGHLDEIYPNAFNFISSFLSSI